MRYVLTVVVAIAAMAAAGCEDDDRNERPSGAGAITQQEGRSPAESPPAVLHAALNTIRQQGSSAAEDLRPSSETDLLPSERGAELLVDRELIDEDKFCAADKTVAEAQAVREAQDAFEAGWQASAPDELDDLGARMYQALSTRCS